MADNNSGSAVAFLVEPFDQPVDITVNAYGKAQSRVEASPLELSITEFETQGTFGRRELDLPVWFRSTYEGVPTFLRPWLRNLSQPPEHYSISYLSLQDTPGRSQVVYGIDTGDAVQHTIVLGDEEHVVDGLTLQKHIMWNQNQAIHTFNGVRRRAVPPAPRTVDFNNITDQAAQAELSIPSPAGESIYGRFRVA